MRGGSSRRLPGQSPRAFPQRSPPSSANLAHLYRVNISPSFQRLGPRETDSHLQPPLPSRSSPAVRQVLPRALALAAGKRWGAACHSRALARAARPPLARSPPAARARPPARPLPPSLSSQSGRWGSTCRCLPCAEPPRHPPGGGRGGEGGFLGLFFIMIVNFFLPCRPRWDGLCVSEGEPRRCPAAWVWRAGAGTSALQEKYA